MDIGNDLSLIAYFLPQFHVTPQNDEWWGAGYTEWTAAARAKPLYPGHYQPHVPADLGFYDLRLAEARIAQAELARAYGIAGFCYYHYWFGGERLLDLPFRSVLESRQPDFPFCLCWANHDWNAAWHGNAKRVLMKQPYPGLDDHEAHFQELLKAFRDERYIRIDGKPLFVIYHAHAIPDVVRVTDYWRERALQSGLPGLYLVGVHHIANWKPADYGLDAAVLERLPARKRHHVSPRLTSFWLRTLGRRQRFPTIYDFQEESQRFVLRTPPPFTAFPCVIPNWDNTPRYGVRGMVLHGSTPELFEQQIHRAARFLEAAPETPPIVFVKAWNEWGEGNHLEPDLKWGRAYLEATARAVRACERQTTT
ncbi:lipopolysaccharide biosynthesis protein [Rubrivivax gelatinosus]|nr:lipopolysaccharide biosynthesis protein [Rubrivivax gelatinosus]